MKLGRFDNIVSRCLRSCNTNKRSKVCNQRGKSSFISKVIAYYWFLPFLSGIYFDIYQFYKWSVRYFKLFPVRVQSLGSVGQRPNSANQSTCTDYKRQYSKSVVPCPILLFAVRPVWFSQVVVLSGWLVSSAALIGGSYWLIDGLIAPLHNRERISAWRTGAGLLL